MKRFQHRRQLHFTSKKTLSPPSSPGSSGTDVSLDISSSTPRNSADGSTQICLNKDKPLFTFRQVELICERMMHEKEDKLREMYEEALSSKLSEQYDMFVKFTHDQIQRRFEATNAPSYLS